MPKAKDQTLFDACLTATGSYLEAALNLFLVIRGLRRGAIIDFDQEPTTASFAGLRLDRETRDRLAHLNATEDPFPRLALFAEAHGVRTIRRGPETVFIQRVDRRTTALRQVLQLPGDFISFTPADYDLFKAVGAFLDFPALTPAEFNAFATGQVRGSGLLTVREIHVRLSHGAQPIVLMRYAYATSRGDRSRFRKAIKRKEWVRALVGLRLPDDGHIDRIDVIDRAY